MSSGEILVEDGTGREVFALTDEQILGMDGEEESVPSAEEALNPSQGRSTASARAAASARDEGHDGTRADATRDKFTREEENTRSKDRELHKTNGSREGRAEATQEPPKWLAREMNDPWVGNEARELWEGVQHAQREIAEFREAVGSREDARALKEIYPGGVAEARSAAGRARELAEIDAVIFGAPGRSAEESRADRVQLVEKLFSQNAAALQEMVEAGVRLLERKGWQRTGETNYSHDATNLSPSLRSATGAPQFGAEEEAGHSGRDDRAALAQSEEGGTSRGLSRDGTPQEVVGRYREFERGANAELERSVGAAIGRAMEAALPNLKRAEVAASGDGSGRGEGFLEDRNNQAIQLRERLQAAVRKEVESALKSDAALGEQVARILRGRRFDDGARSQVVRLIDARAQQLVPVAVKRVVGSWTVATLGTTKAEAAGEEKKAIAGARPSREARSREGNAPRQSGGPGHRPVKGRVDYRKWSDEQILEM